MLKKLHIKLFRGFFFTSFGIWAATFYTVLVTNLAAFQAERLAVLCIPVLAIFLGFSALLYSRARALPAGREQRRSLYAGERALQATVFYLFGALFIVTLHLFLSELKAANPEKFMVTDPNLPHWSFFVPIMLMLYSFVCFYFALRTISERFLRNVPMRTVMRGVRERKA